MVDTPSLPPLRAGKNRFTIAQSVVFDVDARYKLEKLLGKGAYGTVVKATNVETGEQVAIKKIHPVFEHHIDAKRTLRELKILNMLKHPNIIKVLDILTIAEDDLDTFDSLYVVTELMDTDLHQIIKSEQPLEETHFKYFMYQLFKGLKYLHSANVLHRDLKPSNLLLNADSQLKVCDFGLARIDDLTTDSSGLAGGPYTEYVVTRWYRAPEVICDRKQYGKAVDIWSAGCILAELLGRQVLLPGRDQVHQLSLILDFAGTPRPEQIAAIANSNARRYVQNYKHVTPKKLEELFPTASPDALDLLARLLTWDPSERLTAERALEHPFLQDYRDPDDEPSAEGQFLSFEFERAKLSTQCIRRLVFNEMLLYHPELGQHIPSVPGRELALTDDEVQNMEWEED